MTVKKNSQTYAYALIAIVAAVALVAIMLILKAQGILPSGTQENLQGEARATPPALYHGTPAIVAREGEIFYERQDHTLTLTALSATSASIAFNTKSTGVGADLAPGESTTFGDLTLTLIDIDPQARRARFAIATQAQACTQRDGQSPTCRGESTCCNGACIPLPDCAGAEDGVALTCGQRQLYCCQGEITGIPCASGEPVLEVEP